MRPILARYIRFHMMPSVQAAGTPPQTSSSRAAARAAMRALAPALLPLLVGVLAGCLSSEGADPAPLAAATLACPAGVCNAQATSAPADRQANELSIAVDPTDPRNLIAAGKDYTPDEAGECVWAGIYVSHDGGATWTASNVPGSNWKRLQDPSAPVDPQLSRFWCATDPVVAWGPDGTAYWSVMPYQCDAASGSKTGRGVLPDGGLNDWFWTCSAMYVLVSEDKGATWPIVREVDFGPRLEHDKQWISVSPQGKVLLCWDRDPSYQATGIVDVGANPASQLAPGGEITCSVSSDKGRTWATPLDATDDWDGFFPWVDWDAAGRAWMASLDGRNVQVSSSVDGLHWSDPVKVGTYQDPPPGGEYGWPVLEGSDFRIFALPSLAVDRTFGPHAGNLYVAWFDHSGGDGEVLLTASHDGGATWSTPTRVHHDDPAQRHDQFMPAVAVGPDGTLDVTWLDRRDDVGRHRYTLYHTYSLDGGRTFAPDLRVGEHLSDEQFSHHQNGMVFLGDYLDLDSSAGVAHAIWPDTRNEKADAFVASIARPSANAA